ncbi:MAG: DUF1656 domain-containing protein [Verrucomicrobiales bacterium]
MASIPSEFTIGGIYLPPLLVAATIGLIAAVVTARLFNRFRLSKFLFYPPLVFVALTVIYTIIIGFLLIPF